MNPRRLRVLTLLGAALVAAIGVRGARAQSPIAARASAAFSTLRIAKAPPTECFNGVGKPYPHFLYDAQGKPACVDPATGLPKGSLKVNAGYVWGMTETANRYLWFGTGPNVQCFEMGWYLEITTPFLSSTEVCEFGSSQLAKQHLVPAALGDWRAPNAYVYDTQTGSLTRITPREPLVQQTLGMRWGGTSPDESIVFFGGPDLNTPAQGIVIHAFDAATWTPLGSTKITAWGNIRKSVVLNGVLYVGVQGVEAGGAVLRWIGDRAHPFDFQVVGSFDSEVEELVVHQGRLFAGTTPNGAQGGAQGGVWRSPTIPPGGLAPNDASAWSPIFKIGDYEPDAVNALTYGVGALASFDNALVFGTMYFPFSAAHAEINVYGLSASDASVLQIEAKTRRPVTVFRIDNATSSPVVKPLYAESSVQVYVPTDPLHPKNGGSWVAKPTKLGTPLFGPSGFGNTWNNYTWNMTVLGNALYIGTMDWSYIYADTLNLFGTYPVALPGGNSYGADLLKMTSVTAPGTLVSVDGLGNTYNYGIRTSAVAGGLLYLGTANPTNLATKSNKPMGGWELIVASP
ncbi:MAG: hypothetical protein U0610_27335 [bacterium]